MVLAKFSLSLSNTTSSFSAMDCSEAAPPPPRHGSPRSVVLVAHGDDDDEQPLLQSSRRSRPKLESSKKGNVGTIPTTIRKMRGVGKNEHSNRSLESTASTATMTSCSTLESSVYDKPNMEASTSLVRDGMPLRRLSLELLRSSNSHHNPPLHRRHSLTLATTTATNAVNDDTSPSTANESQSEQAPTTMTTTIRPKRVRFLKRVTYHDADTTQPLTEDECIAAWYNARNYKLFKSVLHNETMDAREAVEYEHYRRCFAMVWDACHGHGQADCDNNDMEATAASAAVDWRDMLRPIMESSVAVTMEQENGGGDAMAATKRATIASPPARQLAASRFRGLERTIFARLVTAHRVAATQAVVQAYHVVSDESYKQRAKRVRQVALHQSKPHQRLARVYAYGDAQLVASLWRSRETASAAPMGATVPRNGLLLQRPLLQSYDSLDSLDSMDYGQPRHGRRHRAKRRNLLMADHTGESTRSVDSMDSLKNVASQSTGMTTTTTTSTNTSTMDALSALNHDLNVTISRRHRTSRRRLSSSSQVSCRNLMTTTENSHVVEPVASPSIAT
jgi:hypothetical protein